MEVRKVSDRSINEAVEKIWSGGIVVYPTETCYGIGCDATDAEAVDRIYDLKDRPRDKGLTVVVGSLETAEEYAELSEEERSICRELMPGPLTLVAEKKDGVPGVLNEDFAFRIPGSETARRLAERSGVPLVATSANVSGEPSRYTVEDIEDAILESSDLVLDAGELERREPSTVIGLTGEGLKVYREGPVKREDVEAVLDGR
ncbi:MAG: L-threonylcarbamoyladenylate synthase [Candidatus Nanohaloarchaea archaeon]|nr:L-threonylcarbamoyladenylate synthase [Candidatus Nanohaloarchaea archaeon]